MRTAEVGDGRRGFDIVVPLDTPEANVERLTTLVRSLLEQNAQLQAALDSRVVIEQAKGVLAERLCVDVGTAFEILRGAARSSHTKLHDLAAEVVASRVTPPAVMRRLARYDGALRLN